MYDDDVCHGLMLVGSDNEAVVAATPACVVALVIGGIVILHDRRRKVWPGACPICVVCVWSKGNGGGGGGGVGEGVCVAVVVDEVSVSVSVVVLEDSGSGAMGLSTG